MRYQTYVASAAAMAIGLVAAACSSSPNSSTATSKFNGFPGDHGLSVTKLRRPQVLART
jgi:hypothetical protein